MTARMSLAAVGAAALLGGTGAFLLPAVAGAHSDTHTLTFTAVAQKSANFSATSTGQTGTDFSRAGKVIGFDEIYFGFNPKAKKPEGGVTLDTSGGFLYGTLTFTKGPVTHGMVTGGTGIFAGASGTITGKNLDKGGTRTAVTITYHS